MSSMANADRRLSATPPAATSRDLKLRARKPLLVAHVIVSAAWLGAVISNLFMGISAAVTSRDALADAYYAVMDRLVNSLMPAASIATLATGLLLAFTTKWGLLRHYWVIAKLVLGVATVVVGVAAIDGAIQDTIAARAAARSASASDLLLPAIIATPTMLATAATLAIVKPWGRTSRGRRLRARARARSSSRAGPAPAVLMRSRP
jgi:uncharacterized membrane protein